MGQGKYLVKQFTLPKTEGHPCKVSLSFDFYAFGSWDWGERFVVYYNDQVAYTSDHMMTENSDWKCDTNWKKHTIVIESMDAPAVNDNILRLVIGGDLDSNVQDESYGVTNIVIRAECSTGIYRIF